MRAAPTIGTRKPRRPLGRSLAAPTKDSAGNVYDDESEQDDGPDFSSAMKQKMINEAGGLGADPNKKNPFLLVFFGIGVFVVAGALSSGML